jgi:transcriptional regulator with XRE-family HTH domain
MKQKKAIATYRIRLGWNQETMAEYLCIGRVLLGLAEIGERQLPAAAHFKLMDLIQAVEQATGMVLPDALLQAENEHLCMALQKELDEMNYQWHKQTRELEKLEKDYADTVLQIQFFEYIGLNPTVLNVDEKMRAILETQAKQSLRSWQKNLKAQVFLKQIAIESLVLQKDKIEGELGALG